MLLVIVTGIVYLVYAKYFAMTPDKVMKTIVEKNRDAVISVGIRQDGNEENRMK